MIFYKTPNLINCPICGMAMLFKDFEIGRCKIVCTNGVCKNRHIQYRLTYDKANVVKEND